MAKVFRSVLFAAVFAVPLVGCVQPPPQYMDNPTVGVSKKVSPYQHVRLGVVTTSNYAKSIAYVRSFGNSIRQAGYLASSHPLDPRQLTDPLNEALSSRFASVLSLANPAEARTNGVDMVLTLDARVVMGLRSFQTTSVKITGSFSNFAGVPIDTVAGAGKGTVPFPATTVRFDEAVNQALKGFTSGIDSSAKLLAAAKPITRVALARERAGSSAAGMTTAASRFPDRPLMLHFAQAPPHADDVAVIIGNADYKKLGKDIPNVMPAYADADSMKLYVTRVLGIREGNIIFLKDATGAQMTRIFGSEDNPHGQLYDWVKPGRSRVFVYYAGHGAPGGGGGSAYLVPADADSSRIELNGYPLSLLYKNLGRIRAQSVTVVLEACFSGVSQSGAVISHASPVFLKTEQPKIPSGITVISAGAANQMASWEQDESYSLFTEYYLKGMAGAADKAPYGNGDGRVSYDELGKYLKGTLSYYARRYYGRDQAAQIVVARSPRVP